MKFTKEQLIDLIETANTEPIERLSWRHGHKAVYVFFFDGRYYRVVIPVHHDEGWQIYGDTEAEEVRKVEVVKHDWVKVG